MAEQELEIRVGRLEEKVEILVRTMDSRFNDVDAAFVDHRQYTEHLFETLRIEMQSGFQRVDTRFNRLERKVDQFVDTQSKQNELTERRLTLLEDRR